MVIDEIYFVGERIVTGDSVRVQVDVSKTGRWSYVSDTINGISFSGGGIITDTGIQFISVAPDGIPVLPGNFVYSFVSGNSLGKVFLSVIDRSYIPEAVPADTPYFKVTIDNINYHVINDNNDPSRQISMWSSRPEFASVGCGIGPGIYPNPPGTGTVSLQKGNFLKNVPDLTSDDFRSYFQPGSYRYAIRSCRGLTDGLMITWNDSDSKIWTTNYVAGQEGSYFKITGITDGYNSNNKYYVKVKMKFRCKLYSFQTGEMKELTNGEMLAYFVMQ